MNLLDWLSIAEKGLLLAVAVFLWSIRKSATMAVTESELHRRLNSAEKEIDLLRKWKHEVIVPWQQELILKLDDRYLLRREQHNGNDSPWPDNRRR